MTQAKTIKILMAEDSESDELLLIRALRKQGIAPKYRRVQDSQAFAEALGSEEWDLVLSDFEMPMFNALDALDIVKERRLDIPFVIVSGTIGEETAVAAMRSGAHDYLMKGDLARLGPVIRRELSEAQVRKERERGIARIKHLNRVLRATRNINQLIVREREPRSLIESACRNLVETRGYRAAWITMLNQAGVSVGCAQAGFGEAFAAMGALFSEGWLPECAREALRLSGEVVMVNDASQCRDCPLRESKSNYGSLTVGLVSEGRALGLLSVSLPQAFSGDDEEITLLSEMASDMAYALRNLEIRRQRREAEEAVRAAAESFQKLFDESAHGVVLYEMGASTVHMANRRMLRMTGLTAEELDDRGLVGLHSPKDVERVQEAVAGLSGGESASVLDVQVRGQEGSPCYANLTVTQVELEGAEYAMVAYDDVTERRQLQEQLVQAQKMESVGRLAGGVAHDFNNLLTVILGYCSFLGAEADEESELAQDVDQIEQAARRAMRLTKQLLAFSRRQTLRLEVLDLGGLLTELLPMIERLIGEDLELVVDLSEDLGRVKADAGHMEQILMNLVVNARDAMPQGGRLSIELGNVELSEDSIDLRSDLRPGPHVVLKVTDTGSGMDSDTMDQVFEPFFTTKDKGKGTGLGLSTVYGIVRQHHGSIRVQSEPGRGTTFRIYLPRTRSQSRGRSGRLPLVDLRARDGETVLMVEDEDAVRAVGIRMLENLGYEVLWAQDGPEALKVAREYSGEIHLLLTDVVMPGPSGAETASMLLELRPALKVLFMSGYTDDAIVHHGVLERGLHLVEKPFSVKGLGRAVRQVLDASPEP